MLYHGEGALLEFLRANVEDWELSLGKVIRPELLERTDLAPSMEGASDTFMGVKLALSELDTPEYAQTEQALKQQLQEAEIRQAAALAAQNECEQRLAKANEDVRNAELVVTQKDNAVKALKLVESVRSKIEIRYLVNINRHYRHASKKQKLSLKPINKHKSKRKRSMS